MTWLRNIFLAILVVLAAPPAHCAKNPDVWRLEQREDSVGPIVLYISHDAVKAVSQQWGYQIVAKAPSWTVHCFRPAEKTEWSGDLDHFSGCMLSSPVEGGTLNAEQLNGYETGIYKGLKYKSFAFNKHSHSVLYGAEDIDVSPRCAEFVSRLYDLPYLGKIPIYRRRVKTQDLRTINKDGTWLDMGLSDDKRAGLVVEFVTNSWKKVPYKAADFDWPKGYKKLPNASHVAFSKNQKDDINNVLSEIGFASSAGRGQSKSGANQSKNSPTKNK